MLNDNKYYLGDDNKDAGYSSIVNRNNNNCSSNSNSSSSNKLNNDILLTDTELLVISMSNSATDDLDFHVFSETLPENSFIENGFYCSNINDDDDELTVSSNSSSAINRFYI